MTLWLCAILLIAPVAVLPSAWGIDLAQAKNAGLIWLGLTGVIGLVRSWWLRGFLGWAALSFVLSGMRLWGLAGLLGLVAWTLAYGAAARARPAAWPLLRGAIVLAAGFQVLWMGLQVADLDPIFRPLSYQGAILPGPPAPQGWFANPSDTALFLGLALPSVVVISPWLALPVALALLTLRSSAGLVCLLVAAFWWARTEWRRFWPMCLVMLGVVWGFLRWADPQGIASRWLIWQHAWQLGWMMPWTGWGLNSVGYRLQTVIPATNERWDYVFNEWLQGFVELGWPGLVLAAGFVGSLCWRGRTRWRTWGETVPVLLALFGVSVISIPFHVGPVALLGAVHLGRLEALDGP